VKVTGSLPCRLLVDLPNWVGDMVMALPAVHRLAQANAQGTTVLHARPPVGRLLEQLFPSAAVLVSPRRAFPFTNARSLVRCGGRFDLALTMRHAPRAKLLLALAAARRLGSVGGGGRLFLNRTWVVDRGRHQVHDSDPLLEHLGLDPVAPDWRPPLPRVLLAEGAASLEKIGAGKNVCVGLAPAAASSSAKRWPPEHFGALARLLAAHGPPPVVLVGPGEESVAVAVAEAAGQPLPVVGPSLDVAGLTAVLGHLRVVVANDTGPLHLAALAGARLVALFGPTDSSRTGPLGEGHRILSRRLSCAPCLKTRCPLEHHDCLRGLLPEQVCEAVVDLLATEEVSGRVLPMRV